MEEQRYCPDCGVPIYHTAKKCRSCHNRNRYKKDDILVTRRSLKIGIRGLPEYLVWKEAVMGRDGYQCRGCSTQEKLDIHHLYKEFDDIIIEFTEKYKELMNDKRTLFQLALGHAEFWDITNGVTVCRECHKKCHSGTLKLENR